MTARRGPTNAIQGIGEATTDSSGSNSWTYGSKPIAATSPATRPTAPKRSSTGAPAPARTPDPAQAGLSRGPGARRRAAKSRCDVRPACSTTSTRRIRKTRSRLGTAAIAAMAAIPTRPLVSRLARATRSGATITTSPRVAAAAMMRSGPMLVRLSCPAGRKEHDPRRHQAAGDGRHKTLRRRREAGRHRQHKREAGHARQKDRSVAAAEDSRPHQSQHHQDGEAERRPLVRWSPSCDPQRKEARRHAQDQSRGRARRHDSPHPAGPDRQSCPEAIKPPAAIADAPGKDAEGQARTAGPAVSKPRPSARPLRPSASTISDAPPGEEGGRYVQVGDATGGPAERFGDPGVPPMTSSWGPQWTRRAPERAHPLMRERGAQEATNFLGPPSQRLGAAGRRRSGRHLWSHHLVTAKPSATSEASQSTGHPLTAAASRARRLKIVRYRSGTEAAITACLMRLRDGPRDFECWWPRMRVN